MSATSEFLLIWKSKRNVSPTPKRKLIGSLSFLAFADISGQKLILKMDGSNGIKQGSKSLARRARRPAPAPAKLENLDAPRRASAGKIFLAKGIFIKLYEHALKPVLLSRNNAGKSPKNDPFYSFIHFNTHMLCKNSHFRAFSKFWRAAPRQRRKIWKSWRAAPRQAPEILKCWRAAPRQHHQILPNFEPCWAEIMRENPLKVIHFIP